LLDIQTRGSPTADRCNKTGSGLKVNFRGGVGQLYPVVVHSSCNYAISVLAAELHGLDFAKSRSPTQHVRPTGAAHVLENTGLAALSR